MNESLDLQAYLQCNSLDLLALTETFLSAEILDGEVIDHCYIYSTQEGQRSSWWRCDAHCPRQHSINQKTGPGD